MKEQLLLGLILIFFILAFGVKNVITLLKTKQSIKGKSKKLSLSIAVSSCIYILLLIRLFIGEVNWLLELTIPFQNYLKFAGYGFVILGFIIGLWALIEMKSSWRVGIKHTQKTALITTGVYRISRNPYFLSYGILIFGYFLIFPSVIILLLLVFLVVIFHKMILEEEVYLVKIQGEKYKEYKEKVNRYITLKI